MPSRQHFQATPGTGLTAGIPRLAHARGGLAIWDGQRQDGPGDDTGPLDEAEALRALQMDWGRTLDIGAVPRSGQ